MKTEDFQIGMVFMSSGGFWYKCTDIGTRTITAIRLPTTNSEEFNKFYQGPPYIIKEEVFDEHCIKLCSKSVNDGIHDAMNEIHPGFDDIAMEEFFSGPRYPEQHFIFNNLLNYDRLNDKGNIIHPYRILLNDDNNWFVKTYDIFNKVFDSYTLDNFIKFRIASETDYKLGMIKFKDIHHD